MQRLFLMRHSYAASGGYTDEERPLTDAGRSLVNRIAPLLAESPPDLILASTAVRATETAELIQLGLNNAPEIHRLERLYLAPPTAYVQAALDIRDAAESIMVVGHNPGMASLVNSWSDALMTVLPGCVAVFESHNGQWPLSDVGPTPTLTEYYSKGVRVV